MNSWPFPQPIKTAPKDGTLILILGKYRISDQPPFHVVRWDEVSEWVSPDGGCQFREETVAYWWPLPIFELVEEAK